MTRLKDPLYSQSAKGLINGFLLFKKRFRPYVEFWREKKYSRSMSSLEIRAEYGIGISRWRVASAAMKAYYNSLSSGLNYGGQQYHLKEHFDLTKNNYCGYTVCNIGRCRSS